MATIKKLGPCPECGYPVSGVRPEEGAEPGEQDIVICVACERLLTWENGQLKTLTQDEFMLYPAEFRVDMERLVAEVRRAKQSQSRPQ